MLTLSITHTYCLWKLICFFFPKKMNAFKRSVQFYETSWLILTYMVHLRIYVATNITAINITKPEIVKRGDLGTHLLYYSLISIWFGLSFSAVHTNRAMFLNNIFFIKIRYRKAFLFFIQSEQRDGPSISYEPINIMGNMKDNK